MTGISAYDKADFYPITRKIDFRVKKIRVVTTQTRSMICGYHTSPLPSNQNQYVIYLKQRDGCSHYFQRCLTKKPFEIQYAITSLKDSVVGSIY